MLNAVFGPKNSSSGFFGSPARMRDSWRAEPVSGQDAMTSAQSISLGRRGRCAGRSHWVLALMAGLMSLTVGCQGGTRLQDPHRLAAPYPWTALWAVAPLINESGTTAADTIRLSDALTEELQQVRGINTVPVTRTLAVMHRLGMPAITTNEDATRLMRTLGVDGLIVGSITAWDPYQPPTLGLALQLFIRRQPSDPDPAGSPEAIPLAAAQAAGVFDASDHTTLQSLARFADGRTHPTSAYGADLYLVKMDLYTKFVAHQLLANLLRNEHDRLAMTNE